jgi:hypothetical protein
MSRSDRELRWKTTSGPRTSNGKDCPAKHEEPASIETLKITARAEAEAQNQERTRREHVSKMTGGMPEGDRLERGTRVQDARGERG